MSAEISREVIDRFLIGGRLVQMPAKHAVRLAVLDRVAQSFEIGVRYSEKEVNEVLVGFFDDYAALRRYLIDNDLLSREDGVYWRSGGTV